MRRTFFGTCLPLVAAAVAISFSTSRVSAVEAESFSPLPADHSISEPLFSFASLSGDSNDLPLIDVGLRQKKPVWDLTVGAAILTRGTQAGSPVLDGVIVTPSVVRAPLVTGSDLRSNWAGGIDIGGTRALSPSRRFDAVSVRYFDVQGLQSNASVDGAGVLVEPAYRAAFFGRATGDVVLEQGTDLFSFEANGVVHGSERIDWLSGFRWIGINDSLTYRFSNAGGVVDHTYEGGNSLYGGQLGASIELLKYGRALQVFCAPKAGLFLNQAVGAYEDVPAGLQFNHVFRNQLAFAGDISFNARYRITEKFSVQVGYQLLWLNGIAVAADQAKVMGPDHITGRAFDSSGSAFFHGALVGGNFVW